MKTFIVMAICSFGFFSWAQETKTGYQTMDLKQFENVNAQPKAKSKVSISSSCTTADGRVVAADSPEYAPCTQSAKVKDKTK